MKKITLRYDPEDDHSGELTAIVRSDKFAGKGSAWFSFGRLREFELSLGAFPIEAGSSQPLLEGGFGKEMPLDQVHLRIKIAPVGHRGLLGVTVLLATPVWPQMPAEADRNTVSIQFPVTYGDVARFQSSFRDHLNGKKTRAVLEQSPT